MFLEFGIYLGEELVHIHQVSAGKTQLTCPYCGGLLVAKKGKIKIHHFSHLKETCREVIDRSDDQLKLPFYDKFDLNINPKSSLLLENFHSGSRLTFPQLKKLIEEKLIYSVPTKTFGSKFVLTKLAKIFFGEASLYSFSEIQEEKILEKYKEIESLLDLNNPLLDSLLTDLKIYRNQLKRVLSSDLYFIEIETSGGTFYKIGVTTRNIDDRLSEIKTDIKKHFQIQSISVLRLLKHRGSIETYFKYRYKKFLNSHLKNLGGFTEYFNFDKNDRKRVLSDLTNLGGKMFSSFEEDILDNKKTAIERNITKRKNIAKSMRKTAGKGRNIGRPKGSVESRDKILAKYPLVIEAINNKKLSLIKSADFANVSINTVRLVKKILETN